MLLGIRLAASAAVLSLLLPAAASADVPIMPGPVPIVLQGVTPPQRTISLSTSSHVDYAPDLARVSLGVHSDAPTASAAADRSNMIANAMYEALLKLGIEKKDVQTTQYDVSFTPAEPPTYSMQNHERVIVQPARAAYYTVTTTFSVKSPIAKAGQAIDAAVQAGANASYGLSFESSHIDEYYAQALSAAMQSARIRAAALASAGGVTIDTLQSVATTGGPSSAAAAPEGMMMRAASFAKAAPIVSGTQSVDASVDVVYTIK